MNTQQTSSPGFIVGRWYYFGTRGGMLVGGVKRASLRDRAGRRFRADWPDLTRNPAPARQAAIVERRRLIRRQAERRCLSRRALARLAAIEARA